MSGSVEFGVGLFPTESPRRMVELIQLAEELGYTTAYVGDSQVIWREAYVLLGAAAQATTRITLATGVTNPVTRDLSVLASAWMTLHELSDGRTLLGIGTGDSSLETLNKTPATLAELEAAIRVLRALIAGDTVKHPHTEARLHLGFGQHGTRIPIYPAVSSPRIHRLAGRLGDGAITLVGTDPAFLAASRRELEAGAAQSGRDLRAERFRVVCWTPCSIQDDGRVARAATKAHVARILKRQLPFELDDATHAVVQRIREQYDYYEHMVPGTAHGELVPDDLVDRFAIAGSPNEAREQIARLAASGLVDEIAIIPHTQRPHEREHIIRQVGAIMRDVGIGGAADHVAR